MRDETIRRRAIVTGRVQGVGFRYFAHRVAPRGSLTGFVRNLPDGSVEVEAQGTPAAVDAFFDDVRRGPPGSRVSGFRVEPAPVAGGESGFEIRY